MSLSSQTDTSEDGDQEPEQFAALLQHIRLDRLPQYASSLRRSQQAAEGAQTADTHDCTIKQPSLFGSYHVVYVVAFADGARWVCKIPVNGYADHFDESSSKALRSEALTTQMLVRETTIPLPRVHHFDASVDNELCCPFILMDFIDGIHGPKFWFDDTLQADVLEQRRTRLLQDLASANRQLSKYTFDFGGSLDFDDEGNLSGVTSKKDHDIDAMLQSDDVEQSHIVVETGPFTTAKDFMLRLLDRRHPPEDVYSQGIDKLLRLFITWVTEDEHEPKFVLVHPDFDIQNVIATEDGALAGLIDWDCVGPNPRIVGCESFPSWLTRDWDPAVYCGGESSNENTVEELARYRSMYVQFMRATRPESEERQLTGRSLLCQNLQIAADVPYCTSEVVDKIFEEVLRARSAVCDVRERNESTLQEADSNVAADRDAEVSGDDEDMRQEVSRPLALLDRTKPKPTKEQDEKTMPSEVLSEQQLVSNTGAVEDTSNSGGKADPKCDDEKRPEDDTNETKNAEHTGRDEAGQDAIEGEADVHKAAAVIMEGENTVEAKFDVVDEELPHDVDQAQNVRDRNESTDAETSDDDDVEEENSDVEDSDVEDDD